MQSSAKHAYGLVHVKIATGSSSDAQERMQQHLRLVQDKMHYGSPWVNSRLRRCLDIVVAVCALVMLWPVMLICAALVRLSSPGPILFSQRRMGRDGNEFVFYKFRSMHHVLHDDAPTHTAAGDRRITRVGALLRRFKLDELPQFWNVLKGDMSLVGPRPKIARHEALRMAFRPGITGEATLAFRNEEQLLIDVPKHEIDAFYENFIKPVKAEIDASYMRRATLRTDVRLLCLTAVSCFRALGQNFVWRETARPNCVLATRTTSLHLVPRDNSGSRGSSPVRTGAD